MTAGTEAMARMDSPRYHIGAMALHWVTALLVVGLLASGLALLSMDNAAAAFASLVPIHASFGITVLILTIVRIALRLAVAPPKLPRAMPGWERLAARATHAMFYLLLVLIPMSGWVIVSVGPEMPAVRWFGLFDLPLLPPPPAGVDAQLVADRVTTTHGALALTLGALVLLHMAAGLRHAFVLKDGLFQRMLP